VSETRTERTIGVTSRLTPASIANLFVLRNSQTWGDLLDVLEQCCIEIETELINTPVEDEAAVLAKHRYSKAAWVVFETMQEKVAVAATTYQMRDAKEPLQPMVTAEEREMENTINPMNYPPAPEDYYGPQ
jgi:hypothetical protein